MSKTVQARLLRLEAAALPPGRVVAMFAWGKTDAEIEAEQADMNRCGVASQSDTFQVFTWMEPTSMPRGRAAKVP